jgi:hypothetical protein
MAAVLLANYPAKAQDTESCKSACVADKKQCRATADSKTNIDLFPPIQVDDGNATIDKKRDMRAVLDDKQRRQESNKKILFDRYQDCEKTYLQCGIACRPVALPPSAKASVPQP